MEKSSDSRRATRRQAPSREDARWPGLATGSAHGQLWALGLSSVGIWRLSPVGCFSSLGFTWIGVSPAAPPLPQEPLPPTRAHLAEPPQRTKHHDSACPVPPHQGCGVVRAVPGQGPQNPRAAPARWEQGLRPSLPPPTPERHFLVQGEAPHLPLGRGAEDHSQALGSVVGRKCGAGGAGTEGPGGFGTGGGLQGLARVDVQLPPGSGWKWAGQAGGLGLCPSRATLGQGSVNRVPWSAGVGGGRFAGSGAKGPPGHG